MPPRKRTEWLQIGSGRSYFHRVHRPLQCLIFITPLLLIYQIGSLVHPWSESQAAPTHVVAFVLMRHFFAMFGAAGNYLPLLAVVAILLAWHLARKDPWDLEPKLYLGMAAESLVWSIPLIVIGLAVMRHMLPPAFAPGDLQELPWQTSVVLSIGAGVYEELLFRLVAITVLNIILVDVFELKVQHAIPLILVTSAVIFSLYHYLGNESFAATHFFFRSMLGVYLAAIFIYRGFGIAVGCHATYDLLLVAMYAWRGQ